MAENRSLLIVDDNPDILTSLEILLRSDFSRIDTELRPEFIPQRLQGTPYDVILLDMNFTRDTTSGTEGFQWLEAIRHLDPGLPVVLFTGYGDVETAVEAIRCGAHDFVLKPWDNDRLIQTLVAACRPVASSIESTLRPEVEIEKDLLLARQVQLRLLPQETGHWRGLDHTGYCQPARHAGGDYFDFLEIGNARLGIALADVSGKGVAAALLMASLQGRLQSIVGSCSDPGPVMDRLNRDFYQMTEVSRFASMVFGVLDERTRILRYTNAGHLPPLLCRDGEILTLPPSGPVLGIFPDASYVERQIRLCAGDTLLLYTDGLTEATNPGGEEFGVDRVTRLMTARSNETVTGLRDALVREVREFSGARQQDDLTMIVAKVRP